MSKKDNFFKKHAMHEKDNKEALEENIYKEKIQYENNIKNNNNNIRNNSQSNNTKIVAKREHKAIKIIFLILFIFFIVIGSMFGGYLYNSGGNLTGAVMNMVKDALGDQEPIFVLVMGVSDDISVELTDTIMLIGYNPDTNQAFILSIPRDTFVGKSESWASGYDKINALYQTSPQKTIEAVENLTGVNIDYYVTVKTTALVDIVNAIGGVEFDVPINMDYDDSSQNLHIHLKAGKQILNGDQAEQLVRFRHNNNGTTYSLEYGDNDEGRMRTQREFLKEVSKQLISWNNVDKLKEITTAIFNNLTTDIELSKVLGYIPYAVEFDVENNLSLNQLPGKTEMINELWFYRADQAETQTLMNSYIYKLGLNDDEKSKYIIPKTEKANSTNLTNKVTTNTTTNVPNNRATNSGTTTNNDSSKNITNTTNNVNTNVPTNITDTQNTTKDKEQITQNNNTNYISNNINNTVNSTLNNKTNINNTVNSTLNNKMNMNNSINTTEETNKGLTQNTTNTASSTNSIENSSNNISHSENKIKSDNKNSQSMANTVTNNSETQTKSIYTEKIETNDLNYKKSDN